MAPIGFIHDTIEIKFLILYITSRLAGPVDLDILTEITMCDQGVDYFSFTQALAELVDTGHLTLEDGLYAITDKGRRNGGAWEDTLPYSIRAKCQKSIAAQNSRLRRDAQIQAKYLPHPDGTATVRLSMDDNTGNLLTLELFTASEAMGKKLCDQFRETPEEMYNRILDVLLGEPERS